jgi:nucleoside 2-deoxyribosyltransferase
MKVRSPENFSDNSGAENPRYGVVYPRNSTVFGELIVTEAALGDSDLGDNNYRVCSVLREYFLRNKKVVVCKESQKMVLAPLLEQRVLKTNDDLLSEFPSTTGQRQDRILQNLHILAPNYGDSITTIYSWDCFAKNENELFFFLQLLLDRQFLSGNISRTLDGGGAISPLEITAEGWERLEALEAGTNSFQAFIAMAFAPEMNTAYSAIESACSSCGFKALRIDTKEHNNEIVGEILYEINRSRFVVADVTGQRHGVYFEAGFAIGSNRPVIWTCKSDDFESVHFDTSHFNYIVWLDEKDLTEKLVRRIKATILLRATQ